MYTLSFYFQTIFYLIPIFKQPFGNFTVNTNENETKILDYSSTHREIVEACQKGQPSAQKQLYKLYSRAMYNICIRMVKNEMDAEDLLQNSFVDVFCNLKKFRFQSSIGAWIKRIVINNCINFLKKRKLDFETLDEKTTPVSVTNDESEPLFTTEAINEAIYKLPSGYRVVFTLYLMEGYDHKEIASILDISEATSKSQFSRAKQKIRTLLK